MSLPVAELSLPGLFTWQALSAQSVAPLPSSSLLLSQISYGLAA